MKESSNPSSIRSKQEITSALLNLMRKYPYSEITVKQIAFNIGAIWNVIFKWVDRGMKDSLEDIRNTIDAYLKRLA